MMKSVTIGQQNSRLTVFICAALAAFLLTPLIAFSQTSADGPSAQIQQLKQYPLNDFGELFTKLQNEVTFPPPRNESHLLPLLPQSTVFYAAFPNYGTAAQQALNIFRRERQSRPALRDWWQSGDIAKTGPQIEMAIEQFGIVSQYIGDEIVIAGAMNGAKQPSIALLAEVRKPGLKQVLELGMQLAGPNKPTLRVLDKQSLASATEGTSHEPVVLVRPDYVIAASDLETLRNFDRLLDSGTRDSASTAFGQ